MRSLVSTGVALMPAAGSQADGVWNPPADQWVRPCAGPRHHRQLGGCLERCDLVRVGGGVQFDDMERGNWARSRRWPTATWQRSTPAVTSTAPEARASTMWRSGRQRLERAGGRPETARLLHRLARQHAALCRWPAQSPSCRRLHRGRRQSGRRRRRGMGGCVKLRAASTTKATTRCMHWPLPLPVSLWAVSSPCRRRHDGQQPGASLRRRMVRSARA